MGFEVIVLLTALMRIHSAVCSSDPPCNCSVSSGQVDEMKTWLTEAINLTSTTAQIFKDSRNTAYSFPEDCEEIYLNGNRSSGVYTIWPRSRVFRRRTSARVFCDMETDGGGWTVIQRRGNFGRPVNYFYKNWIDYKLGFGSLTQDFWIGNNLLVALTNQKLCSLRFDLRDAEGESRWATYDKFWVDPEEYNYTMNVQGYMGNAGDSFGPHDGRQFSTKDRDNDLAPVNCADMFKGGWWYGGCHLCNLNGLYLNGRHQSFADGIEWEAWHGMQYSLPHTEMKIRPI